MYVLVHDGWHGAWEWADVITWLEQRGGKAVALDLPGHGALYQSEEVPGDYSLSSYAKAVADFVRGQQQLNREIVLVGHGTAGPILQLVGAELVKELAGLIFLGAYILRDGESISEQMPPEMADMLGQMAESRPDARLDMSLLADYWRFNVMSDDARKANEVLAKLAPEPSAPLFEKIKLPQTNAPLLPCAYISFNEDMSLPPGEFHPRMAGKLGAHRHLTVNAGHEGPLTKPRELAEGLIFLGQFGLK